MQRPVRPNSARKPRRAPTASWYRSAIEGGGENGILRLPVASHTAPAARRCRRLYLTGAAFPFVQYQRRRARWTNHALPRRSGAQRARRDAKAVGIPIVVLEEEFRLSVLPHLELGRPIAKILKSLTRVSNV